MPFVKVGTENSADIEIYYEDHGAGQPVVLIHGYPLSGRAWDKQVPVLLDAGHRVITYDRRGFGKSSQPASGYDYDTFAADLNTLLEHLDLRDAVLAGHSMGTGEVTRYLGSYGSARVAKGVLVSPIPPYLLQAGDNPDGVPQGLFDGFAQAARADTPAWMKGFLDSFYNIDTLRGTLVSDQAWQASWNLAVTASATAAVACIGTWTTDFRDDLPKIDVPMLVIHGDADQVLPLDKTASRLPGLIKDMQLVVIEGAPHDNLRFPGDDTRLDLTDVFAFRSTGDPGKTVLIIDSNPTVRPPIELPPTVITSRDFHPWRGLPDQRRHRRRRARRRRLHVHLLRARERRANRDRLLCHRRPGPRARAGRPGAHLVHPGQLRRNGAARPGRPDPAVRRGAQ
jgi:non-heme chloroperoxidase